jgi:hypothetical protein
MRYELEIPRYSPERGLTLVWEPGSVISVVQNDREVVLHANRAGLVSLARHLLTLAQEGVPCGHHVHFDELNALEPGSAELVVGLASDGSL